MNKRILFAIFCLTIGFSACQKAPELSITGPTSVEVNADGGSSSITFTTNRDWTVTWSESWISVSPSSCSASDGPVTISIRCNSNTTYEDRSGTVTIKAEDLTQTINVRQPANLGLIVPTRSYDIQSGAKTIEVEVQSNVQYSVAVSVDWIKQTGTKGLMTDRLVFSVEENQSYDSREGSITIKPLNGNVSQQVISVRQAQKDALNVKNSSFNVPYGGGEIEVKVESNVEFDVNPNVDWIHYVETKALSSSTVCLTVDENPTTSKREGKVVIEQKNGSLSHTITVKEAGRIAVTSVSLNKTSLRLKEGESETLIATVKPDNASDKTVTWTTSNASVADVDDNGTIYAYKEGTATITASAGGKKATCSITVKNDIDVTSVQIKQYLYLAVGESETLEATVKPDDATDKTVTWKSSNNSIVSVDSQGKVTAKGKGNATISATAGLVGAECTVFVKAKRYDAANGAIDLGLSVMWATKNYGASTPSDVGGYYLWGDPTGSGQIAFFNTPDINYISGTQYDIATRNLGNGWRIPTNDEIMELLDFCDIQDISQNGNQGLQFTGPNGQSIFIPLSGLAYPADGAIGSTSIQSADRAYLMAGESYADGNGRFAYVWYFDQNNSFGQVSYNAPFVKIPVRPVYEKLEDDIPVSSVSLNTNSLSLKEGESATLVATVSPNNATDKTVTWSSSDKSIATVSSSGKVTAVKTGSAKITAQAGDKTATCLVSVQTASIKVTSITLNKSSLTLSVGSSETLIATLYPSNATETVHWGSSNPDVASVDSGGKVAGLKIGSATITAIAGEKTATCSVSVVSNTIAVTSVTLDQTSLSLQAGESVTLKATVKPDNATDKTVTWSSSDSSVATVDINGKVTANNEGIASITARAGEAYATCSVAVDNTTILNGNMSNACFIITQKGQYRILCSEDVSNGANSAFVLWNENGKDDIINLTLKGNYVYFEKPSFKKGNAVVSLANDGVIVRSWHLWSTDEPQFIDGIMDRNLGATSVEPDNEDAYGLMYSYGSPFPFPGAKYKDWMLTSEPSVPEGWYVAPGYGFYAESKMPTEATPMLYCTSSDKYGNSIFWRNTSKYSPCPAGTSRLSHTTLQDMIGYEPSLNGLNGIVLDNGLFIPAAGTFRAPDIKGVTSTGTSGGYWGNEIYNDSAVDASACWFYEGLSNASSYYRGNTLHSIRARK